MIQVDNGSMISPHCLLRMRLCEPCKQSSSAGYSSYCIRTEMATSVPNSQLPTLNSHFPSSLYSLVHLSTSSKAASIAAVCRLCSGTHEAEEQQSRALR